MFCYLVLSLKVPTHSIILVSKNTLSVHVVNPKYHPLLKGVRASGTENLSRSGRRNVQDEPGTFLSYHRARMFSTTSKPQPKGFRI